MRSPRRIYWVSEFNSQRTESLEKLLASRPNFVETLDGHRNNGDLQMCRQNCGSLFENLRIAVDTALSLRKEKKNAAMTQTECASAHGRNQIRIGIDHDDAQPACDAPHETRAKDVARSHREDLAKYGPGKQTSNNKRINVALVIRREDKWTSGRKPVKSGYAQIKTVARKELDESEYQEQRSGSKGTRFCEIQDILVPALFGQNRTPAKSLGRRHGHWSLSVLPKCIHQLAHRIDFR